MIMRKITLIFIFLISLGSAFSQVKQEKFPFKLYQGKLSNEQFINQSEFIFEGRTKGGKEYLSKDSTIVYTSVIVEVYKVYKGNDKLQPGTVELFVNSGIFEDQKNFIYKEYNTQLAFLTASSEPIIFFCKTSDFNISHPKPEVTNQMELKLLKNERFAGLYYSDSEFNNFIIWGLKDLYFKTKDDFYNYLTKFKGTAIPTSPILKKNANKTKISPVQKEKNDVFMRKLYERD